MKIEYALLVKGRIISEGSFDGDMEDVVLRTKSLQLQTSILGFQNPDSSYVRGFLTVDGESTVFEPQLLESRLMVFHAVIGEEGSVGFDDYPTPLEDCDMVGLPPDAKLVHRFPKMWAAKSMPISMIVELDGHWWWRVHELPNQFWADLVTGFKKVHVAPKSNMISGEEMVAQLVKELGGFQPKIIK